MDLNKLYADLVAALQAQGLTEIEIDLKPKQSPGQHVKIFISCQTKDSQ